MTKSCRICGENFKTKSGTYVATVSLFLETSNKEFSGVLSQKQVVLGKLLQSIGIFALPKSNDSVCKKCARKVVNCYKLFQELKTAFTEEEKLVLSTISNQRSNQRSPTGLTPSAKRSKINKPSGIESNVDPKSKKSLFGKENIQDKNSTEQELSSDAIKSLMNIPSEICGLGINLPPIVKVRVAIY
jgi:hypothetical protein